MVNYYNYLSDNQSLVLVLENQIIYESYENSVKPLVRYIYHHGKPNINTILVDKIIGYAIANVICYANIKTVYTNIISKPALTFLEKNKVDVHYKTIVDNILRRDRTDICPMEKKILSSHSPQEAFDILVEIVIHENPVHLK